MKYTFIPLVFLIASCGQSGTNVVGFDAGDCIELSKEEMVERATKSGLRLPLKFTQKLKGTNYNFSLTKVALGGSAGQGDVRQSATLQAGTFVTGTFNEIEYNFVTKKKTSLNVMENGFSCRMLKN